MKKSCKILGWAWVSDLDFTSCWLKPLVSWKVARHRISENASFCLISYFSICKVLIIRSCGLILGSIKVFFILFSKKIIHTAFAKKSKSLSFSTFICTSNTTDCNAMMLRQNTGKENDRLNIPSEDNGTGWIIALCLTSVLFVINFANILVIWAN